MTVTNGVVKAGVWYSVSNILLRAVSIITAPIFTRLLTTSEYGKVSNFVSWQNMLLIVFSLSLNYSVGRAKIDYAKDFRGYISSIQSLSSLFATSICVLSLPFINILSSILEIEKRLLLILLISMIFYPSIDYLQTRLRFEYKYKENILIAVVNTLAIVVFSIILIGFCGEDKRYLGRIIGIIIPTGIISLTCFFKNFIDGKWKINFIYWKYALRFSIPIIPHSFAMMALGQIDRIMILKYVGSSEAGVYSFGYSYAVILSVVVNSIMNAWQPWLFEKLKLKSHSEIKKSCKLLNFVTGILTISFVLIAPEVLRLLGSESYWEAKKMVTPVALGTLFQFFYTYFVNIEMYCKQTSLIAVGSVGGALINYILNLIFIPRYGYIVAAYTTMIGYLLLMLYHMVVYKCIYRENVFDIDQIMRSSVFITLSGFGISIFNESIKMRYLVGVILGGIYILNNKNCIHEIVRLISAKKDGGVCIDRR